jgi:hypothetical protein
MASGVVLMLFLLTWKLVAIGLFVPLVVICIGMSFIFANGSTLAMSTAAYFFLPAWPLYHIGFTIILFQPLNRTSFGERDYLNIGCLLGYTFFQKRLGKL